MEKNMEATFHIIEDYTGVRVAFIRSLLARSKCSAPGVLNAELKTDFGMALKFFSGIYRDLYHRSLETGSKGHICSGRPKHSGYSVLIARKVARL